MKFGNFSELSAQSGRFASEPEAVAPDCALRLNRLPTAGRLWCGAYVAPRVSVDCYRPIATAGRRAGCAGSQTSGATLARLRLPAGLSSATE